MGKDENGASRLALVARRVAGATGVSRLVLEEARAMAGAGWAVDVVGARLDRRAIAAAGARSRRVWMLPASRGSAHRFATRVAGLASGYALVHGHGDLLAQDVMSLHNCVHAEHEAVHGRPLDEGREKVGYARLHAQALSQQTFRVLVVNSRLMRGDVEARYGVPRDRIELVSPGHDPAHFRPGDRALGAPLREKLGVGPGELLVGLIASGDLPRRGVPELIPALALAARSARTPLRAVVVGKSKEPQRWLDLAAAHGLAGKVHVLEPVARPETLLHSLDVFAWPARFETFGMAVLEAMACGLPLVVAPRVGAIDAIAPDAREQLLPSTAPDEIARALVRLADDPDRRRALGASNVTAAAELTWERHARRLLDVYARVRAERDRLNAPCGGAAGSPPPPRGSPQPR